jgi:quercetin dioxygenase-like cupin family protein
MENRRAFLTAAAMALAVPRATEAAGSNAKVIARHPLSAPFEGMEATLVEVTFTPGSGSTPHRHPGFVLGYVLEGEFRFSIRGEPEKVLAAGSTFYEPPDAVHTVSGSALPDKPARILAFMVAEKGKDIVLPL